MARRPPRRTALNLLCLGAFVASTVGSASGAHGCSHHDGPAGSRAGHHGATAHAASTAASEPGHRHGPAATAHTAHHGGAAHDLAPAEHDAHRSDTHAGHGGGDEHGPCTCLGDCHPGAAVPLSAPSTTRAVAVAHVSATVLPTVASDGPALLRDAFRLHLPNAPPARL